MQRVKEKAIQLLHDQIVDRVIGWRAGEFFYDLTPSVFTSVEDIEKNFVWSVFSGANLSKYLIAESRKGGKAAVFLASDLGSAVTGEIMFVDCGYNNLGI